MARPPSSRISSSFNPRSPCGERQRTTRPTPPTPCFNPRSPCGERRHHHRVQPILVVSTHAPLAGSDARVRHWPLVRGRGSTHAPLAGSDVSALAVETDKLQFQPTLPLRGATLISIHSCGERFGFNPRSPCGERRARQSATYATCSVSTHAPLAGSDASKPASKPAPAVFQPTLPLRGATRRATALRPRRTSFNPRSPCGERL